VQRNLITALSVRLRGGPCESVYSKLKILVAAGVRYPDAFVVCSSIRDKVTFVTDSVIVFEIISPSSSGVDRITKNQEYRDTASIKLYVILEQDRQAATVFSRDRGDWVGHVMPEIGISVPLAELYAGVELLVDPLAEA
jgi:Uma2 family endonuclease